jgi:hypothetical protein
MANLGKEFLTAALGSDGAKALLKAVARQPQLGQVLMPRAILGWLDFATAHEFEGEIPGLNNSYIQFTKSDEGFSGSISLDDQVYTFQKSNVYHLAASIATAIGLEPIEVDPSLRDTVLVALGDSIDTLAKAQVLVRHLHKSHLHHKKKTELEKVDLPGKTHQPTAPEGPQAPTPPNKQPSQVAKKPKLPKLSIAKAEAEKPCEICGGKQFANHRFQGCICYRDISKSVRTTPYSDGYVLEFAPGTDIEVVRALMRTFQ